MPHQSLAVDFAMIPAFKKILRDGIREALN
jgi:hypothetical protein